MTYGDWRVFVFKRARTNNLIFVLGLMLDNVDDVPVPGVALDSVIAIADDK